MKIEIADYVELADGGAVVVFEMDEDARKGLVTEALERRILDGLERMVEINYVKKDDRQADIEGYLEDLADMEAGRRMDTVEPTYTSPLLQRMDEG